MEVGIIGGGMMGLATAFYLGRADIRVTILEKEEETGGLSSSEAVLPDVRWDRFYHVILPTDSDLLQFIGEIGLSDEVDFRQTRTGFYTDGRIHSMSSTREFLSFKPLSLWNKLRLGVGILYASRLANSPALEAARAQDWLTKVFGRTNYHRLWEPLLRSKLGTESSEVSASFIWAYIHRLYGTRRESSKKELLGCVKGGYDSILTRLQERIGSMDGHVLTDHAVQRIEALTGGKIGVLCTQGRAFEFDRVISTIPSPQVVQLWPDMPVDYKGRLEEVRYLKLICANLVLKKSLSPYYIMNLTDSGFPFTGLIEATHLIPSELLGGRALVYLPRYMPQEDPFYEKPSEEIVEVFLKALKRIFPDFSSNDVVGHAVHKEPYVQPIQELNYSTKVPPIETPLKGLYLVNTTMIQNSSLNNNQVIGLARRVAQIVLTAPRSTAPGLN